MIFAIQNYVLDQKSHNYSLILFGPNALGPNNINVFVTSSLFGPNAFGPIRSYENIIGPIVIGPIINEVLLPKLHWLKMQVVISIVLGIKKF